MKMEKENQVSSNGVYHPINLYMKERSIKMENLQVEASCLIQKEPSKEISKLVSKRVMEFTNSKHKFDMRDIIKTIKKMEEEQLSIKMEQ